MERPDDDGHFWFHRQENGWPPVPEALLDAAKRIAEQERQAGGMAYVFCGVPVSELTEREAKAALVLLMHEMFKPKPKSPFEL